MMKRRLLTSALSTLSIALAVLGLPGRADAWASGTDGLDPDFANSFGQWRGAATTSNWVNMHWIDWDWLTEPGLYGTLDGDTPVHVYPLFENWNGVLVLSMSMAGNSNVPVEQYEDNMRACAAGEYNEAWETFGRNATAAGRTGDNTVVSLAHEFNGTWFKWNPGNVGLEVWLGCWRNVYTAIHNTSNLRVAWVFSATNNTSKNGDYALDSAWDAYPTDDYVDVIGINRYDFSSLNDTSTTDWRDTCDNPQDMCATAQFARDHHKLLGVPEWSSERGEYGNGDNPNYIDLMVGFFRDHSDVLFFENLFQGTSAHNLYPENDANARASARYNELY